MQPNKAIPGSPRIATYLRVKLFNKSQSLAQNICKMLMSPQQGTMHFQPTDTVIILLVHSQTIQIHSSSNANNSIILDDIQKAIS